MHFKFSFDPTWLFRIFRTMRNNQPVTQHEQKIPVNQTLVSVTDQKGRITCCNRAFIEISGFAREELLGQPHNIVRHSDMPG